MQKIQDYAIIGDCRSAALVSREGSIDWLCWPRFDSASILGALLDPHAGRWRIAPTDRFTTKRRYRDGTNVLETSLRTDTGAILLTDLMPVASEEDKRKILHPEHELLRLVECEEGELDVEMIFDPQPNYRDGLLDGLSLGGSGCRIETGHGLLNLRSSLPLRVLADGTVYGRRLLRAGDALDFSLTFSQGGPAVFPPLGARTRAAIDRSVAWWRSWSGPLRYNGPSRPAVIRSALLLRLLFYAPSGAIIAAPTTSLPERLGAGLNWDYRYCWLRDASLTVRALLGLGCMNEAEAFVNWLLHSTRLTRPELRILYDIYGRTPHTERTLSHLSGYHSSQPVRIGNAAADQLQLDVYGEVIDAVTHFICAGGVLDRETRRMLCSFGDFVCRHWREADEGIWEPRSGRYHNTHSRVLCWTALDRLIDLHANGQLPEAPAAEFAIQREAIRCDVEERGWNPRLSSYAARLNGDDLDASLLLIPWYGFAKASSPRMRQTYALVRQRLGAGGGLLYRYRSDESPGEGAFGICSFWGAEYLALGGGTVEEAQRVFEGLLGYSNDLGLFAEEIDPNTGDALGNFPQAFTHVGLINAALSLTKRREGKEVLKREIPLKVSSVTAEARL